MRCSWLSLVRSVTVDLAGVTFRWLCPVTSSVWIYACKLVLLLHVWGGSIQVLCHQHMRLCVHWFLLVGALGCHA